MNQTLCDVNASTAPVSEPCCEYYVGDCLFCDEPVMDCDDSECEHRFDDGDAYLGDFVSHACCDPFDWACLANQTECDEHLG